MRSLFRFFVYSNLFIAACAVVMVDQTCRLLLHTPPGIYFILFVFFATISSYSFHWYLTSRAAITSPRIEWLNSHRNLHLVLFLAGITGCGIFFFYLLPYWHWLLLSGMLTFLYSAPKIPNKYFRWLRKIALGKTIFLAMVWTYVTAILPILLSGEPWKMDFILFILGRFFLIYAICILFDFRDREDDKVAGIRSLITLLNEKGIFYLFTFSLFVFFVSTLWMLRYGYDIWIVGLLLLPGIITACLFNYAKRNFADIFYYFVLDGLMALSAICMLIAHI